MTRTANPGPPVLRRRRAAECSHPSPSCSFGVDTAIVAVDRLVTTPPLRPIHNLALVKRFGSEVLAISPRNHRLDRPLLRWAQVAAERPVAGRLCSIPARQSSGANAAADREAGHVAVGVDVFSGSGLGRRGRSGTNHVSGRTHDHRPEYASHSVTSRRRIRSGPAPASHGRLDPYQISR